MVNVHEKYPDGAVNKAAYSTDEKSSASEPSASNTVLLDAVAAPTRPTSERAEHSTDNVSSGVRDTGSRGKDKSRDSSRNKGENEKGRDRGCARAQETRDPSRNRTNTSLEGALDQKEADKRAMEEIQGRIEARRAARDLELSRLTIKELKSSMAGAPLVPSKLSRKLMQRSRGDGDKETGKTLGADKTLANPVARGLIDSRGDDALFTLKFASIGETRARPSATTDEMASTEMGIALVASALGKKVPKKSSDRKLTGVSESYVELDTNWEKSRTTVSIAPPNSRESDDPEQAETLSEMPLSHSDVQIGLPGDAIETATGVGDLIGTTVTGLSDNTRIPESTRPCAGESGLIVGDRATGQIGGGDGTEVPGIVVTEVAANEEVNDEPVAPGLVSTPLSASINEECVLVQEEQESVGKNIIHSTDKCGVSAESKSREYAASDTGDSCRSAVTRRTGEAQSKSRQRGFVPEQGLWDKCRDEET